MPRYSASIDRLLQDEELLRKLSPSEPSYWPLVIELRDAKDEEIAGEATIVDPAMWQLVRGALLYAVDALDPAHKIFQDAPSDLGSYWHGMMHRREADFDNARYWFRRAGRLPFFDRLHDAAREHSSVLARQPTWDPYLFTGECEQAKFGDAEKIPELAAVQRVEWETLLDYCWGKAVAA
jgi:hypothetical protein